MFRCWRSPTTKDAYRLSWASIIITILAFVAGLLLFLSTGSSLALVFGLENCVDFLSSAVVLWRFFAPSSLSPELEQKLNQREERASMAISFILILLGLFIIATAVKDFLRGEEETEKLEEMLIVAFFSVLIFGTLAGIKFRYSNKLQSPSLYKDGLCSLIGTILAGALFINTLIIREESGYWWIDPVVSVVCGVGALLLGIHHLIEAVKNGIPIFASHWWFSPQAEPKAAAGDHGLRETTDNPAVDGEGELELKGGDEAAIV